MGYSPVKYSAKKIDVKGPIQYEVIAPGAHHHIDHKVICQKMRFQPHWTKYVTLDGIFLLYARLKLNSVSVNLCCHRFVLEVVSIHFQNILMLTGTVYFRNANTKSMFKADGRIVDTAYNSRLVDPDPALP